MNKSKRKKKKAKAGKRQQSHVKSYKVFPNPFMDVDESKKEMFIRDLSEKYSNLFESSFEKLKSNILECNPLHFLSFFSINYLTNGISDNMPHFSYGFPITQYHIEFFQALILQHNREEFGNKLIDTVNHVEFCDYAIQIALASQLRSFDRSIGKSKAEQEKDGVIQAIRGHTMEFRNFAYPHQISRVSKELFSVLDDDFEQMYGVKLSCLLVMLENIQSMIPPRIINIISDIVTKAEVFHFDKYIKRITDTYTLTIEDFCKCYPTKVDPCVLKPILDKLTFRLGDLKEANEKDFLLNNPIWTRPFIQIDEKAFFVPITTLFQSHSLELFEALIKDIPQIQTKYYKRRSRFLEDEAERLFKNAFPTAIIRNVIWIDVSNDGIEYENDLVVLIDSIILLIEAKSGKVSPSALRGGEDRLKRVLKELVIQPAEQSERFANYLIENRAKHDLKTKNGQNISIDTTDTSKIIRISVTLELLPTLFSRWHRLVNSDLIRNDVSPTLTVMITDLEDVFEILETPYEKIHYLMKRYEFENSIEFDGDEIDMLAYYIESGFNDSFLKLKNMDMFGIGKSAVFEEYFMNSPYGISVKKPKLNISKWWKDILDTAISRNKVCWTSVAYIMLSLSHNEQCSFRNSQKGLVKSVKKHGHIKGTPNTIEAVTSSNDMIVCFCHKNLSQEERDSIIQNIYGEIYEETDVNSILIMGTNVERKDYPYSFLGLSHRDSKKVVIL